MVQSDVQQNDWTWTMVPFKVRRFLGKTWTSAPLRNTRWHARAEKYSTKMCSRSPSRRSRLWLAYRRLEHLVTLPRNTVDLTCTETRYPPRCVYLYLFRAHHWIREETISWCMSPKRVIKAHAWRCWFSYEQLQHSMWFVYSSRLELAAVINIISADIGEKSHCS